MRYQFFEIDDDGELTVYAPATLQALLDLIPEDTTRCGVFETINNNPRIMSAGDFIEGVHSGDITSAAFHPDLAATVTRLD